MAAYNSSHTGQQIDNYDNRIATLESQITSLTSTVNTNSNNITNIQNNYATKAQVNSLSMVPTGVVQSLTLLNSAKKTAWTKALDNWIAPSNGWLCMYCNSTSSTPAAVLYGGGVQHRASTNSTREFTCMIPVKQGWGYTGEYINCAVVWIQFIPVEQI